MGTAVPHLQIRQQEFREDVTECAKTDSNLSTTKGNTSAASSTSPSLEECSAQNEVTTASLHIKCHLPSENIECSSWALWTLKDLDMDMFSYILL